MRDLETAGRAVVDTPPLAPTPVDVIETSGRRRRLRRRGGVVIALLSVLAVIAGGVAFAVDRHPSSRVAIAPHVDPVNTITDEQMRAHLGLDVPAGWVPVDYGDARLFVPPDWAVTSAGCPTEGRSGWLEVGVPQPTSCVPAFPLPKTSVRMLGSVSGYAPESHRVVNGYDLYPVKASPPNTYAVPDLGTTVSAAGPDSQRVLATIAPSARYIALNYRAPVPDGWHEVSHAGITLSVPADWPVVPATPTCDFDVPGEMVTLGTPEVGLGCGAGGHPAAGPSQVGVAIGDPYQFSLKPLAQVSTTNGTVQTLLEDTNADRVLLAGVPTDSRYAAPIRIGLGRDGRIAAAIFDSIRLDASPSDSTSTTDATVRTTTTEADSNAPSAVIVGTWQPVSIAGYHGPLTPPGIERPLLRFASTTDFTASDGCNDDVGTYRLDSDGAFQLGRDSQTLKGCNYTKGSVPHGTAFPVVPNGPVLRSAARVDVHRDTLRFLDPQGNVLATYARVTP